MTEETTIGAESYCAGYSGFVFYIVSMILVVVIYWTFFDDNSKDETVEEAEKKTAIDMLTTFKALVPAGVNRAIDLQILLDSSGSVGNEAFTRAKEASKMIADCINKIHPISKNGSRIDLITFSVDAKLVFKLGDHPSCESVKDAIDSVNYDDGGSTATAPALQKAKAQFQTQSGKNVKVVWLLTDGKSNSGGNPIDPAEELKSMDVTICVVPVGSDVDMTEVNSIASPDCVYPSASFESNARVMEFVSNHIGGASTSAYQVMRNYYRK